MSDRAALGRETTGTEATYSSVIEQLLYLVDELAAQKPLFAQISEAILCERPFGGALSIKDHYVSMLHREEIVNSCVIEGLVQGTLSGKSVDNLLDVQSTTEGDIKRDDVKLDEIQSRISVLRKKNVDLLSAAGPDVWELFVQENNQSRSLAEWAFRMALEDADTLRNISTQLSEIQLLFKR